MIDVKKLLTQVSNKQKESFGDWLKEIRTGKGVGVRELASMLNGECSASYISYLERNVYSGKKGKPTRPSETIVEALAAALEVPLDEARFAAGYKTLVSSTSKNQFVRLFPSLFSGYGMLSETGKKIAERQIDSVIRGLMEMEGIRFSDGKHRPEKPEEDDLLNDVSSPGLDSEEFTIDLSNPEPAGQTQDSEEVFHFMTDEELNRIENLD